MHPIVTGLHCPLFCAYKAQVNCLVFRHLLICLLSRASNSPSSLFPWRIKTYNEGDLTFASSSSSDREVNEPFILVVLGNCLSLSTSLSSSSLPSSLPVPLFLCDLHVLLPHLASSNTHSPTFRHPAGLGMRPRHALGPAPAAGHICCADRARQHSGREHLRGQ